MTQIPAMQYPQFHLTSQPSYNAVKIDIHNPQVNTPGCCPTEGNPSIQTPKATPVTAPMYSYPQAPVYEVPKKSIYEPQKQAETTNIPPVVKEITESKTAPAVPAPVIIQPVVVTTPDLKATAPISAVAPVSTPISAPIAKEVAKEADSKTTDAPAKTIEVKTPQESVPKVDVNAFIKKLTSPDFDVQASTMETIANMVMSEPAKATELLDVRVIDTLLGIMNKDSSKIEGPTAEQMVAREKIMSGKAPTEAEVALANKITPMELAERNKQYSIYTVAILQKLYGSEIEKMSNTVVPLTELPGAAGVVEQIKSNPNPMVRIAGIDAMSYVQRPEYQKDLATLFTVAQKDQNVHVQKAATKALEKLAKLTVASTPVQPQAAK